MTYDIDWLFCTTTRQKASTINSICISQVFNKIIKILNCILSQTNKPKNFFNASEFYIFALVNYILKNSWTTRITIIIAITGGSQALYNAIEFVCLDIYIILVQGRFLLKSNLYLWILFSCLCTEVYFPRVEMYFPMVVQVYFSLYDGGGESRSRCFVWEQYFSDAFSSLNMLKNILADLWKRSTFKMLKTGW